jgi:hypothetical protein
MIPISIGWSTASVHPQTCFLAESQLVPTVSFAQLPWLLPAVQQLSELQAEGRDIPGLGDLRISEETGALVRRLLAQIRVKDLDVPQLVPMSGGGVGVSWSIPDREVSFKVFPSDEEVMYVVTDTDDNMVADGVFNLGHTASLGTPLTLLGAR